MPYDIQWDDEAKTIIVCTVSANFSVHGEMADVLREVITLSTTVEHPVGSIVDWSRYQPFIRDNTIIFPRIEAERSSLSRGFSSSKDKMLATVDYWIVYAANTKQGAPPHKITIVVLVLETLPSSMRTVTTSRTKFTTASNLDEAREMIHAHFQQGDTDQKL